MKRYFSIIVAVTFLCTVVFPCKTFADADDAAQNYVAFAESQLGKRGGDDYGLTMEWCVWFTTFCANNTELCSSADKVNDNVFPPFDRSTWEENNWAATGVTYQVNWMMANDKGTLYKFANDKRITANDNIIETSWGEFEPVLGDLIYFDWKSNSTWDHVAIVKEYLPETDEVVFIGGNQGEEENPNERAVTEVIRERSDPEIAGYMRLNYEAKGEGVPMPVTDVNATYKIKSDTGVKLRKSHGLDYDIEAVLPDGALIFVTVKTARTVNGYTWACTEYDGITGWFALKYAEEVLPLLGDADSDGVVNTRDATCILKYSAGMIDGISALADVNRDGVTNTADAALVLKYTAGIISGF